MSEVQTADADRNNIHNILRKLQRSVNRIEDNQKALQDDLKALQVQVQARQSQRRHSLADIDALAEAVVAKLQTNGWDRVDLYQVPKTSRSKVQVKVQEHWFKLDKKLVRLRSKYK